MAAAPGAPVGPGAAGATGGSGTGGSGGTGGSPAPTVSDKPNYAFVTSATYVPGQLGGVAAGDAACNGLARAAGLPAPWPT